MASRETGKRGTFSLRAGSQEFIQAGGLQGGRGRDEDPGLGSILNATSYIGHCSARKHQLILKTLPPSF